jgi:hypothetical protein
MPVIAAIAILALASLGNVANMRFISICIGLPKEAKSIIATVSILSLPSLQFTLPMFMKMLVSVP